LNNFIVLAAYPLHEEDVGNGCRRVNNNLVTGQRTAIEGCLKSKGETARVLITEKRKECLRLYQSLRASTFNFQMTPFDDIFH